MEHRDAVKQLDSIIAMVDDMSSVNLNAVMNGSKSAAKETPAPQKPAETAPLPKPTPVKKIDVKAEGATPLTAFFKSNIQICRIAEAVPLENSDKLLVCKVEVAGEAEPRTLVAGMAKYYSPEEFTGKLVVAILNLKPAKLAGIVSSAMVCAGSVVNGDIKEVVKVLEAPEGSELGDRVLVEGYEDHQEGHVQCNDKQWKRCVTGLRVIGGFATVDGHKLRTEKGYITCPLPGLEGEIH